MLAPGGEAEVVLDPALADRISDFVLAAEAAPPRKDASADRAGPVHHDGGPIHLPRPSRWLS
ncbi:hypothetical protein [Roseomonas chloroacetimidivorans]|uniref:hypothetical protein n=1 Tax=Roseomonas chloroacetimidivorans TaxID=1766656 RepID=UPI003C7792A6